MAMRNVIANHKWSLYALLVFAVSRLLYAVLGVSYQVHPPAGLAQILDVQLLRTRLLESIYYLHSQPPLFNLFLGALVKYFPYVLGFKIIYLLLGAAMTLALFHTQLRLKMAPQLALIFTSL